MWGPIQELGLPQDCRCILIQKSREKNSKAMNFGWILEPKNACAVVEKMTVLYRSQIKL